MSAVWVRTDPTPDGVYRVTIEADEDTARILTPDEAYAYAAGVLAAAARAEYDAAIVAQLTALLTDKHTSAAQARHNAAATMLEIRQQRPPLDTSATTPITLTPGVSHKTGEPFLAIDVHGETVGQWTIPDARSHALHVLESIEVADLDAGYRRALRSLIGLTDGVAQNVIGDVARFRPEYSS